MFSPSRQAKTKVPITISKINKCPSTAIMNSPSTQNLRTSRGGPSFLKQSPSHNPEGKKFGTQKEPLKPKPSNTSIKQIQEKLGEIGTIFAGIKTQTPKFQSPNSKKKMSSKQPIKTEVKKTSSQAGKKKPVVASNSSLLYKKDPLKKPLLDISKNTDVSKKPHSPNSNSGFLNPRLTADKNDRAKIVKAKVNDNPYQLPDFSAISRTSFKVNNAQQKKMQPKKQLKSNQHSHTDKNLKAIQDQVNKLRETMSGKQFSKYFDKSSPILNSVKTNQNVPSYQISKSETQQIHKKFDITQDTEIPINLPKYKQKRKASQNTASSSIISASTASKDALSSIIINPRDKYSTPSLSRSQSQHQIRMCEFSIIKKLGQGKFSQVFLGIHKASGFMIAIKQLSKQKIKKFNMIKQVSDQIRLHYCLNHPNIIKLYSVLEDQQSIYLILEYVEGGSLFDQLALKQKLSMKQAAPYLRDVISALKYLHEKSIAHRDIKPQNILVSLHGVAKLCDLGWAAVILTSRKTYCGTFDYVPPEILERKDYDLSVDIWCLGVLTYELLTGKVPYQGDKHTVVMSKINNVQVTFPQLSQEFPPDAKKFIQWLLQHNPQERPKSKQLLDHSFFDVIKEETHGHVTHRK